MDKHSLLFMNLLHMYLPKLDSNDKKINQKLRPHKLSDEEIKLLSSTHSYVSMDQIIYNKQLICTQEYNETKAKTKFIILLRKFYNNPVHRTHSWCVQNFLV